MKTFLTEPEAAAFLGRSVRQLAQWRKLKIGPRWAVLSGCPVYDRDHLQRWSRLIDPRALDHTAARKRA